MPRGLRMSWSPRAERELERLARGVDVARDDVAHHFVGRRLVHAALAVGARVDAGDVAGRRHQLGVARERIEHADPRVVDSRVRRVARRQDVLHEALRRRHVEDREAVGEPLALRDQRVHELRLVGRVQRRVHLVRHEQQRDLVDGLERGEAGALIGWHRGIAFVFDRRHRRDAVAAGRGRELSERDVVGHGRGAIAAVGPLDVDQRGVAVDAGEHVVAVERIEDRSS